MRSSECTPTSPGRPTRRNVAYPSRVSLYTSATDADRKVMLDYLEAGETIDDFLEGFPSVTREQAVAALEVASEEGVYQVGRSLSQALLWPTTLPVPVVVSPDGPAALSATGTASLESVAG